MTIRRNVLGSLITTKIIIGVTGILLLAYLILHIAGNLMVFLGRDTFKEYSHALISNPLVVPVEIGLLVVFLIHLFKAVRMTVQNQTARPATYTCRTARSAGRGRISTEWEINCCPSLLRGSNRSEQRAKLTGLS